MKSEKNRNEMISEAFEIEDKRNENRKARQKQNTWQAKKPQNRINLIIQKRELGRIAAATKKFTSFQNIHFHQTYKA